MTATFSLWLPVTPSILWAPRPVDLLSARTEFLNEATLIPLVGLQGSLKMPK
jgi:hypothetical protein